MTFCSATPRLCRPQYAGGCSRFVSVRHSPKTSIACIPNGKKSNAIWKTVPSTADHQRTPIMHPATSALIALLLLLLPGVTATHMCLCRPNSNACFRKDPPWSKRHIGYEVVEANHADCTDARLGRKAHRIEWSDVVGSSLGSTDSLERLWNELSSSEKKIAIAFAYGVGTGLIASIIVSVAAIIVTTVG